MRKISQWLSQWLTRDKTSKLRSQAVPTMASYCHETRIYSSSPQSSSSPPRRFSYITPPLELITRPDRVYLNPRHRLSALNDSKSTFNECCAPNPGLVAGPKKRMGFSKSQRICILLAIDSVFFLIELVVGMFTCILKVKD